MATGHLYINTRDELVRISSSNIVYIESDGNCTNIVLTNKQRVTVFTSLGNMQQFLSDSLREHASTFVRLGRRFIVNIDFVYKVQPLHQSLILTDGMHFTFQLNVPKDPLRQLKDILSGRIPSKTLINIE